LSVRSTGRPCRWGPHGYDHERIGASAVYALDQICGCGTGLLVTVYSDQYAIHDNAHG